MAANHFDVLVVDRYALKPVDLLYLADEVIGERLDAQHAEDVVGHWITVHQQIAFLHIVALMNGDVLTPGNEIRDRLDPLLARLNHDATLGLVVLAELDAPGNLGHDRVVLRLARLEQLGHAGQTPGDVACFGGLARNAGEHVAGVDGSAILDAKDRVDRHEVARLQAVGQLRHLALLVAQGDTGAQLGAAGLLLPIDDHLVRNSGCLVDDLAHRGALDHVDVVGEARGLRNDRQGIGIPFGEAAAFGNLGPVFDEKARPIRQAVAGPLTARRVSQHDLAIATHHDQPSLAVDDDVAVADGDGRIVRRLDVRLLGAPLRGTADVKSAHGQLGARFADRLGGDHADRLTHVYRGAACEITTVALGAHAAVALAGDRRTDFHLVDAAGLDALDLFLLDHLVGLDEGLAVGRIDDVLGGVAAEYALG